jgi:membrane protein
MTTINIEKKINYEKKLSKYKEEGKIIDSEVDSKVDEIKRLIGNIESESKKRKKRKLKKRLDSGKEDIKLESNKKYTIIYFYNKNDNKIILKDIVEYIKEEKEPKLCVDAILAVYTIIVLLSKKRETIAHWLLFWFFVIGIIIFCILTFVFYYKNRDKRYSILGKDWLDKLLLELYSLEEVEYFQISRTIMFSLLFFIYSVLLSTDGIGWQLIINIPCYLISIYLFVSSLFKISKLNFFYFIGIIIIAMLVGSLQSTNWEALVAIIAIISLLFSDEIWKISPDYDNPLEGKYKSKENKEMVERNVFKYKITLSVISLVLFIILKLLGNKILVGKLILGKEFDKLNTITTLLYKGLDRFIIAFILVFLYFGLKQLRKFLLDRGKEFEKPILDRLIQFVYKDLKLALPIVKTDITIDKELKEIFEPKTLIENLNSLPDDIIVSMKTPIKEGNNTLFIHYADGTRLLKKDVNINFYERGQ